MKVNGSSPKKKVLRTEVVLSYAIGVTKECAHGTRQGTRTVHAKNASRSMRKFSGGRTTIGTQPMAKETTVGLKDKAAVA